MHVKPGVAVYTHLWFQSLRKKAEAGVQIRPPHQKKKKAEERTAVGM